MRTRSSVRITDRTKREGHLHVDVLGGQFKTIQVVVARSISIRVQTGGEVTAGHGHTHHSVANTWELDATNRVFFQYELSTQWDVVSVHNHWGIECIKTALKCCWILFIRINTFYYKGLNAGTLYWAIDLHTDAGNEDRQEQKGVSLRFSNTPQCCFHFTGRTFCGKVLPQQLVLSRGRERQDVNSCCICHSATKPFNLLVLLVWDDG